MSVKDVTPDWAEPGGLELERDDLQARLDFYRESIVLRTFSPDLNTVRMIDPEEVADMMVMRRGLQTGLLPKGALWVKHSPEGTITALYREPGVWAAALQEEPFEPPARLRLPMPGLVFICSPGRTPWIFAAAGRPENPEETLYSSPTFNTFENGRVCPGTHRFPDQVEEIPESFFRSFFSMTGDTGGKSKRHPHDLHKLWRELDGAGEYPMEDLVEKCTVADALELPGRRLRPQR